MNSVHMQYKGSLTDILELSYYDSCRKSEPEQIETCVNLKIKMGRNISVRGTTLVCNRDFEYRA